MASSDSTGLYIFGIIIILIIGLFAYSYLNKRRVADRQKDLMKAFRASPVIARDKPIFIQGQAQAPDVLLPSTGEHVSYHGTFVMSKETTIRDTHSGVGITLNGIPLGEALGLEKNQINAIQGFHFFETSGDFTVACGSGNYFVRPSGVMAYFQKGADMVAGLIMNQFTGRGLAGSFFKDAMTFQAAQQGLQVFCGFNAPIAEERSRRISGGWNTKTTTQKTHVSVTTATARIDARVHEYMAGFNIPSGIAELLAKRGIGLPDKDEIIVIEVFIPMSRGVFVFGTFDGDKSIVFADKTVQLSVSYLDPSAE